MDNFLESNVSATEYLESIEKEQLEESGKKNDDKPINHKLKEGASSSIEITFEDTESERDASVEATERNYDSYDLEEEARSKIFGTGYGKDAELVVTNIKFLGGLKELEGLSQLDPMKFFIGRGKELDSHAMAEVFETVNGPDEFRTKVKALDDWGYVVDIKHLQSMEIDMDVRGDWVKSSDDTEFPVEWLLDQAEIDQLIGKDFFDFVYSRSSLHENLAKVLADFYDSKMESSYGEVDGNFVILLHN